MLRYPSGWLCASCSTAAAAPSSHAARQRVPATSFSVVLSRSGTRPVLQCFAHWPYGIAFHYVPATASLLIGPTALAWECPETSRPTPPYRQGRHPGNPQALTTTLNALTLSRWLVGLLAGQGPKGDPPRPRPPYRPVAAPWQRGAVRPALWPAAAASTARSAGPPSGRSARRTGRLGEGDGRWAAS